MEPIELYKKMPLKDCGKCSAGTCLNFATQYLRRMIILDECVELDEDGIKEIEEFIDSSK